MSLTKATYSMVEGAPVNVKDYGAKGDGVTDDTAAIQAAINFCQVNGRKLYFPTGDYRSAELYVTSNWGITIEGEQSAAYRFADKGFGVRFFYTGTSDFFNVNVGTSSSTFVFRLFLSNFTVYFEQNTANAGFNLHNIQESIFRNVIVQGKSDGSQTINNAFILDSAGIVEFDSCIASFVTKVFNCTGQLDGQVTGSLNILNGNFFRVQNVFTGGSCYYCINFYSNWCEGFQNAFLLDTNQSYNGISLGNLNIDNNTFLQTTTGLTQTRVLKALSSDNAKPINFYVNFRGNFCDMSGVTGAGTQPSYAIELLFASNTSVVNGNINIDSNIFWNVLTAALSNDVNAIRVFNSANDTRSGIYGSSTRPFCIPGVQNGTAHRTIASEYVDYEANNSTTEVVLKSIYFPKDLLQFGRSLNLKSVFTFTLSANNKTVNFRLGGISGALLATFTTPNIDSARIDVLIGVTDTGGLRISATQINNPGSDAYHYYVSPIAVPNTAIQELTITGYVANAADDVALNGYSLNFE